MEFTTVLRYTTFGYVVSALDSHDGYAPNRQPLEHSRFRMDDFKVTNRHSRALLQAARQTGGRKKVSTIIEHGTRHVHVWSRNRGIRQTLISERGRGSGKGAALRHFFIWL